MNSSIHDFANGTADEEDAFGDIDNNNDDGGAAMLQQGWHSVLFSIL
jgi:nitrogen fixation protein